MIEPTPSPAADPDRNNETPAHPAPAGPEDPRDVRTDPDTEPVRLSHDRRGQRVADAPDQSSRRDLIEAAAERRRERIEKSAARQQKRKEQKLASRRERILREHLPEGHSVDWQSPRVRRILDRVLTDARERRLFLLPPLPHTQMSGIGRIRSARSPK